jgi:hypothetical protein
MNKEKIEKAFAGLAQYGASLVGNSIHAMLLAREIEKCKREVLSAVKEKEEHGNVPRS